MSRTPTAQIFPRDSRPWTDAVQSLKLDDPSHTFRAKYSRPNERARTSKRARLIQSCARRPGLFARVAVFDSTRTRPDSNRDSLAAVSSVWHAPTQSAAPVRRRKVLPPPKPSSKWASLRAGRAAVRPNRRFLRRRRCCRQIVERSCALITARLTRGEASHDDQDQCPLANAGLTQVRRIAL